MTGVLTVIHQRYPHTPTLAMCSARLWVSLLVVGITQATLSINIGSPPSKICIAVSNINCGGGHDLVPLNNATQVANATACCAICNRTPNCTAWTWNGPYGNHDCYPKTACTITTPGGTSGSANPIPPSHHLCESVPNVNCGGGHDIDSKPVNSAGACCSFCQDTPHCTAWTWNGGGLAIDGQHSNNYCYAKTTCSVPYFTAGVISGSANSIKPIPGPPQPPGPTPPSPPPPPVPPPPTPPYPYFNTTLSWAERVENLVSLMSVSEKVDILQTHAPAIPRLAIRGYSFETECDSGICGGSGGSIFYNACSGPCSTDNVTAFPQSIGMGATWNVTLEQWKGSVIGSELRSIAAINRPDFNSVYGLSCFSPMINIVRDPMWGRNNEGYSECPFLTGEMAHAVVTGMQGDDARYLQVVAGCKHFVPYDGPASDHASDYDLFATYLPAFKRCTEAQGPAWKGAMNVMCSYTKDGYPGTNSCTNPRILDNILKQRYNFSGFVISDLGAVQASVPDSLVSGMDVYLGTGATASAVQQWLSTGKLTMERLNNAVARTLLPRFLEGEFDPPHMVPYWNQTRYGCHQLGSPAHQQLGLEAAVQSLVLLKNTNHTLPLAPTARVAVIGAFATHARWMFARYSHVPGPTNPLLVSVADALTATLTATGGTVTATPGCTDANTTTECQAVDHVAVAHAMEQASVLVFCVGTGEPVESETSRTGPTLALPGQQEALLAAGIATGKPVIVVLFTASPKNGPWLNGAAAVVQAYYPQTFGGQAISDVLLGRAVPSGKLATTWPTSWQCTGPGQCEIVPGQLLDSKLTYRYGATNVLFPFGYGLSYGDFTYSHLQHESTVGACDTVHISVTVTNSGQMRASEAVQVYIQWDDAPSPTPALQLVAFTKVAVDAGASVVVTSLAIPPRAFAVLTHAATNSSQFPSHRRGLSRLCGSRCGLVDSSRQRQELRRPHAHRRMFLPPPSPSPTPLLSRWTSVETVFRANLAGFKTTTAPPVTTSPRTPPALYARKVTAREMFPRTLLFQVWFGMIRRDTHIATPLYKDASCTHHGNGNVRNRITHNMV
eukprot:m.658594 g.658594  ORF g.658594 m.658594 type:complete len:1066 (+) comp22720_c1_seq7:113-3310(+)